jgi:hypothetical protein
VEELARHIYEESPTTAQDLIWVINEWEHYSKAQENDPAGRYNADSNPNGPALLEADRERRHRLAPLRKELEQLVGLAP